MMGGLNPHDPDCSEFVEVDPTGRYGRYNEILGKGASKIVYKAFDEYEGMEVAWNQVKLYDILQNPEDLERLYCEIHLLKTLKHKNIMKFYSSWVDTSKRNINFVTEMFTSGTLRQYRQKHKRVNIRAVKHWCRQILSGLLYLHSHDPPVIHRDLKCDNIFVNGNQGEVKIGDLGLAAILRKSHTAHCVGTPEFMAPEVYQEEYNELVDIYSFGMCVLEMVTFDYPYSECTHPAQIYKKVISGTKPEALYKVKDPELRQFIEKCLATASRRLSAAELLNDPFLQIGENGGLGYRDPDIYCTADIPRQLSLNTIDSSDSSPTSGQSDHYGHETEIENGWDFHAFDIENHGIHLFNIQDDEHLADVDITIKGRRKEDGSVFLRLRVTDRDGRVRNIYFPFDIEADTALSVATEMVAELDITDYEVTRIAEMIDGEVSSLVPGWRPGPGIEEALGTSTTTLCHNCASNVSSSSSLLEYLSLKNPCCGNLQSTHCPHLECTSTHGRFEEITYETEGSKHCATKGQHVLCCNPSDILRSCSQTPGAIGSDEEGPGSVPSDGDGSRVQMNGHVEIGTRKSVSKLYSNSIKQHYGEIAESGKHHTLPSLPDDYGNEIRHELSWLKAKYKAGLTDYRYQQIGESRRDLHPSPELLNGECREHTGGSGSLGLGPLQAANDNLMKSFHLGTHFSFPVPHVDIKAVPTRELNPVNSIAGNCTVSRPDPEAQRPLHCEANPGSSPDSMATATSFYAGAYQPLARVNSLLVDAVDV